MHRALALIALVAACAAPPCPTGVCRRALSDGGCDAYLPVCCGPCADRDALVADAGSCPPTPASEVPQCH
jgi:hypothetical protein